MMRKRGEVVFVGELGWYVGKFDADILGAVERRSEVEIGDVEAGKAGLFF